jgi:hypothetical protein
MLCGFILGYSGCFLAITVNGFPLQAIKPMLSFCRLFQLRKTPYNKDVSCPKRQFLVITVGFIIPGRSDDHPSVFHIWFQRKNPLSEDSFI